MKSFFFITYLLVGFCFSSNTLTQNPVRNLNIQAKKMGEAFVNRDYNTFSKYTNPRVLEIMGGTKKMTEMLVKTINDMNARGMSFSNITFDGVSKMIKFNSELQCTVLQHTEIKLGKGRVVATSALIAISKDNGINWTFVDTSNKDILTLRKLLPDLSKEIIIPPQQEPVQYNN